MTSSGRAPGVLVAASGGSPERAAALAEALGVRCVSSEEAEQAPLALVVTEDALELWGELPTGRASLRVDPTRGREGGRLINPGTRSSPLLKAVDPRKHRRVVDATCGLGRDTLELAAAGCVVLAVERHPVVAALFDDIQRRVAAHPRLAELAARVTLEEGDAVTVLEGLARADVAARPDVVVVDPMFPEEGKSAAVKKDLGLLQVLLAGADDNGPALLDAALRAATARVVVKRPRTGPPLGGRPSWAVEGKAVRFDVYAIG